MDRVLAGRFRITGEALGEGESGVVYPGEDTQTGRAVAIKVLHEHLATDPVELQRMQALAGLAGRLDHPRIASVLGLWSDDGRWFLVMERAPGRPLDEDHGALAPEAVVSLGLQVCEALAAAHAADLLHGDLRPGKVLLGAEGVTVLGFLPAGHRARVRPGETCPEVQEGAPPGVAADLYGLGLVLHRAMTGRAPWSGPTPFAVLAAQQQGIGLPAGPEGLAQLVQQLLHPDPARRPADIAGVASALRRLRRAPERPARVPRRWVAPIRPGHAWMVWGPDPETGARSLVQADLSRKGAQRLAARLREEGWEVSVAKDALGWGDIAWVGLLAGAFAMGLPVIGAVVGAVVGLVWRSSACEHRLREVLPAVTAPIPPREAAAGTEYAVAAGLLLLLTAALLWWWPVLAVLPLILLGLVVRASRVAGRQSVGEQALRARISTVLAEARAALEGRDHALDKALGLQGELDVLERQWVEGELADRDVLGRVELLQARAQQAAGRAGGRTSEALDALRKG